MRNKLSILTLLVGMVLFQSCADEDLGPVLTFDNAIKGAYPRLIDGGAGLFDLNDLANSSVNYTVEFVDIDKGARVASYIINVRYVDVNPANGDQSKEPQTYATFSQSDFTNSEDGFRSLSVSIPASELLPLLNINVDDMRSGDYFRFETIIEQENGLRHTFDNSSATINGGAFAGFFRWDTRVSCPVPDDRFVGTYLVEYIGDPPAPFGDPTFGVEPGTVTLETVSGSQTLRTFSIEYLPALGFGVFANVEFDLVCDVTVVSSGIGTGLGCGGTIRLGPNPDKDGSFTFTDDTEIILEMVDFEEDGGCGVDPLPVTIRLTKQ